MWPLSFISEADFTEHIKHTIIKYGAKLEPYNVEKFNSNIVDPIKLIFDKMVYQSSWEELIKNEIFRQRDKSNNNDIGYFHQRIFKYIDKCEVPDEGWDVIYRNPNGIATADGETVHTVYVEMKNKHNTMNSSASAKTYMHMQSQLLQDDDCICCLVEAIARHSQDIKWQASVDGHTMKHKRIRRMSMDKFYALVTGQEDAFYQMCVILPDAIEKAITNNKIQMPKDSVIDELKECANSRKISIAMAIYLLGFSEYTGFNSI